MIQLRDEEGLTFDEIGDRLDVTKQGASAAYKRAKEKLAKKQETPAGTSGEGS